MRSFRLVSVRDLPAAFCGLLACVTAGCGLVDQAGDGQAIPSKPRWVFLDTNDELTAVMFEDPEHPRIGTYPAAGCCTWSSDGRRLLLRSEDSTAVFIAEEPEWSWSPLAEPEDYDVIFFVGSNRLLAGKGIEAGAPEWVFRGVDGTPTRRFGLDSEVLEWSAHAAAVLDGPELTLLRADRDPVTLMAPGLDGSRPRVWLDAEQDHVVLVTQVEDGVDFGSLPDFVAHIETEAAPECDGEGDECQPFVAEPVLLADTGDVAVRVSWSSAAGGIRHLSRAPLRQRTIVKVSDSEDGLALESWSDSSRDPWLDGPSARLRRAVDGPTPETMVVEERDGLDSSSTWSSISPAREGRVLPVHDEFDLIWVVSEDDLYAMDLHRGGPSSKVDATTDERTGGPGRCTLFFEGNDPSRACGPCRYVAFADPSSPQAPVLRGTIEGDTPDAIRWAPDGSGLLLIADGFLRYQPFAAPAERFPLAPAVATDALRVPPSW